MGHDDPGIPEASPTPRTPRSVPGLELARLFYADAVRPLLDAEFPGLRHGAALIGAGSEVLGFDSAMSSDHHWGPRVMLFLAEPDCLRCGDAIHDMLSRRLPHRFMGYPTNFTPPNPNDGGTQLLRASEEGPINHRVETFTVRGYVLDYLGFDIDADLTPADWPTFPEQRLCTLTGGGVFHDEIGLQKVRDRFAYYPRDVWLYLMAAAWTRISQEEHLMGRAGYAGDELGSSLIGSRLVRDVMRLCFLMERRYAPYAKWLGTAFARLACAARLAPILSAAQHANTWQAREQKLAEAYEILAALHNALGLTEPLATSVGPFWGRPFLVIRGERFAQALCGQVTDPVVKQWTNRSLIGGIDQFSDNTDFLEDRSLRKILRRLYASDAPPDAAKECA